MHNLVIMGILESIGGLLDNISNILWGEQGRIPVLLHPGNKSAIPAKGHDHIGQDRSMNGCLAKVKEWQDVRMVEHGDSPGLAQKQACRIGVVIVGLDD